MVKEVVSLRKMVVSVVQATDWPAVMPVINHWLLIAAS